MPLTELQSRILDEGITVWFANHGGASASQIAEALSVSHEEALKAVEELAQLGHGTLNRDVTLVELSFDPANPENGITQRPFTTNIFFLPRECYGKLSTHLESRQNTFPSTLFAYISGRSRLHSSSSPKKFSLATLPTQSYTTSMTVSQGVKSAHAVMTLTIDTCMSGTESVDFETEESRSLRSARI
jgi:hypothetical protein